MNSFTILVGKTIALISRLLNLGNGSTWPGHVALSAKQNFIKEVLSKNPYIKVVLVAGTNGKTTTAKLLSQILENNGIKTFRNEAGANLLNGVASSIIAHSTLSGKLPYDVAIFEIDENTLPLILEHVKPHSVVILNLFRDQLDRYGEVNTIAKKWNSAMQNLPRETLLFTNGDDPELSFIGEQSGLDTYYFGIDEKYMSKKDIPHDVDFLYCPKCRTRLIFEKMSYSHMGKFQCPKCGFKRCSPEIIPNLPYPLFGTYNVYNVNAAAIVAHKVFGVPVEDIKKDLAEFTPAFGRQEAIQYKGKNVIVLLSKNPTGFNQSIDAINSLANKYNVLLVLNDKIPDGRDVSWIWDVDFENLKANKIFISGDRTYDMGLRIKYTQEQMADSIWRIENKKSTSYKLSAIGRFEIIENLEDAINTAVNQTEPEETLFILPTYSAMLEVRKILKGRKIL